MSFLHCVASQVISDLLKVGLDVDCSSLVSSGSITHQDMVQRSWAYWGLAVMDVCWSLYVGRNCCLPDPSSTVGKISLPPVYEESNLETSSWPNSVNGVPEQPKQSVSVASCDLMRIGRKIVDVVYVQADSFFSPETHRTVRNSGVRQKDTYKLVTEIEYISTFERKQAD